MNKDAFPEKFYIPGHYSEDDLKPFLNEFGISSFCINNTVLREQKITFIITTPSIA